MVTDGDYPGPGQSKLVIYCVYSEGWPRWPKAPQAKEN
jgi:hypothetical protein